MKIGITTLLSCFAIIISHNVYAQQFTVSGIVNDEAKQPVSYATITLLKNDSIPVQYSLTDSLGAFSIQVEKGTYFLTVQQLGQELLNREIEVFQDIELGVLSVSKSVALDGVTVTARKRLIEHKVDRLVFNVENSFLSIGADATEVLKATPRIKIDDDRLTMIGKSGLSVMIDDKLLSLPGADLINYLRTIRSDDIKSIEIITNPPAKYNAEGNSGIINIKLKNSRDDSWNIPLRSSYKQATYATGNWGIGASFKKNKLTFIFGIDYTDASIAQNFKSDIFYKASIWRENTDTRHYSKRPTGRIAFDYMVSSKLTMGAEYNLSQNRYRTTEMDRTDIYDMNTLQYDSLIINYANTQNTNVIHSLNYHAIYTVDSTGKTLSFDFDYYSYNVERERQFAINTFNKLTSDTVSSESAKNHGTQAINNYSFNLDMKHPMEKIILNYGARISRIKTKNVFEFYNILSGQSIYDTGNSDKFLYHENTQALYMSAQTKFSDKFEAKLGVRWENTQTDGISVSNNEKATNHYSKIFPTAYFQYTADDNNTLSLNYGKRISRPGFNLLNPFRWVSSPYNYYEGNPFLQPAFAHNYELAYSYKDNLILSLYYSRLNNGFEELTIIDPDSKIQQVIPENYITNTILGVNQILSIKPLKWYTATLLSDIYYSQSKSAIPVTLDQFNGWNGEFKLRNDFAVNRSKTLMLNISYSYVTAGVDNLDKNAPYSQTDIALKWIPSKKMTLSLYGNDIFKTSRITYTTYSNNIENVFSNYRDIRYFRISLIYNIGQQFNYNERDKKNEDEIDRM